ncbi:unnamed protein product [Prorocentrum cordatum]|uniref:Uncharacterized protein n=1 Tax=Prorocentrum cordatum TaxID=2364126 RepID=A0ABN9YF72_9DINO|nr:unnamed protein product [Polarella glacialis]
MNQVFVPISCVSGELGQRIRPFVEGLGASVILFCDGGSKDKLDAQEDAPPTRTSPSRACGGAGKRQEPFPEGLGTISEMPSEELSVKMEGEVPSATDRHYNRLTFEREKKARRLSSDLSWQHKQVVDSDVHQIREAFSLDQDLVETWPTMVARPLVAQTLGSPTEKDSSEEDTQSRGVGASEVDPTRMPKLLPRQPVDFVNGSPKPADNSEVGTGKKAVSKPRPRKAPWRPSEKGFTVLAAAGSSREAKRRVPWRLSQATLATVSHYVAKWECNCLEVNFGFRSRCRRCNGWAPAHTILQQNIQKEALDKFKKVSFSADKVKMEGQEETKVESLDDSIGVDKLADWWAEGIGSEEPLPCGPEVIDISSVCGEIGDEIESSSAVSVGGSVGALSGKGSDSKGKRNRRKDTDIAASGSNGKCKSKGSIKGKSNDKHSGYWVEGVYYPSGEDIPLVVLTRLGVKRLGSEDALAQALGG